MVKGILGSLINVKCEKCGENKLKLKDFDGHECRLQQLCMDPDCEEVVKLIEKNKHVIGKHNGDLIKIFDFYHSKENLRMRSEISQFQA